MHLLGDFSKLFVFPFREFDVIDSCIQINSYYMIIDQQLLPLLLLLLLSLSLSLSLKCFPVTETHSLRNPRTYTSKKPLRTLSTHNKALAHGSY